MFDEDQNNQPRGDSPATPPSLNFQPTEAANIPLTPNTKIPPPISPAASPKTAEPEDIFAQTGPAIDNTGKDNPFKPVAEPAADKTDIPAPTASPEIPQPELIPAEPAIKAPDSMIAQKPSSGAPVLPSESPTAGGKKKLALAVVVIIIVIGLISAAVWYFFWREPSTDIIQSPADISQLFAVPPTVENGSPDLNNLVANLNNNIADQTDSTTGTDTDNDGLSDEEELLLGTSLQSADTDNDNLYDFEEVKTYKTDPLLADTDGDGVNDGREVQNNTNPLVQDTSPADDKFYQSNNYKFSLTLLQGMVLESEINNQVLFNDNVNQIKLYIYLANTQPGDLSPDLSYVIGETDNGQLIISRSASYADATPYSTDYNTAPYTAQNGKTYLIRYLATKKSDQHQVNFEALLSSFKFLP